MFSLSLSSSVTKPESAPPREDFSSSFASVERESEWLWAERVGFLLIAASSSAFTEGRIWRDSSCESNRSIRDDELWRSLAPAWSGPSSLGKARSRRAKNGEKGPAAPETTGSRRGGGPQSPGDEARDSSSARVKVGGGVHSSREFEASLRVTGFAGRSGPVPSVFSWFFSDSRSHWPT